ncbi:MAG: hypothetical protein GXP25_03835 [Planctomycetes bacterium]|nr:hypothetical protein [Planctomycetota bacterium]
MSLTSDWHIHSRNSCDSAALPVAELVRSAEEKGIRDYGLTDHIHSTFNLPDLAASRKEYLANAPSPRFHFGVEVSCMSQWELDEIATGKYDRPVYGLRKGGPPGAPLAIGLTDEHIKAYGIEYVVAGTHWPMYVPLEREAVIRDYHRQNMFLATHPLVDIVAHPWWWHGHWQDDDGRFTAEPWFDDFGHIPKSLHDEFAAACIERNTVVEINISANLLNRRYPQHFKEQYLDYLADLKAQGVRLCVGSDCHSATYDTDFETAEDMLDRVGIRDENLWRLPPREGSPHNGAR